MSGDATPATNQPFQLWTRLEHAPHELGVWPVRHGPPPSGSSTRSRFSERTEQACHAEPGCDRRGASVGLLRGSPRGAPGSDYPPTPWQTLAWRGGGGSRLGGG